MAKDTPEVRVKDALKDLFTKLPGVTMFSNPVGNARYGSCRVPYGVGGRGGSDYVGYRSIIVTPDMIGRRVAVFCAIEAKRPGEQPEPHQQAFINGVLAAGGLAGKADCCDDALSILRVSGGS